MTSELILIGKLSEIRNGVPICLEHNGIPYFVVYNNDTVTAFINLCPHKEKSFTPAIVAGCVVCPFHNVSFNLSSGAVVKRGRLDVPRGLTRVRTVIEGDVLFLVAEPSHQSIVSAAQARRTRIKEHKRRKRWFEIW